MVRGQPDFGAYQQKSVGATLADMGELAARLASIVQYDRRGDVAYLDDYESPLQRYIESVSVGCSARLDSTVAFSGAQSVKLLTDGTLNFYAGLIYYVAPIQVGKLGIKISPSLYQCTANHSDYEIGLVSYDGTFRHEAYVRINPFLGTLSLYELGGGWPSFEAAFTLYDYHEADFHNAKLVVDYDTGKYVRFLFDELSWDLSAYSYYQVGSGIRRGMYAQTILYDRVGHVFTVWQDDFVFTINEP